MKKTGFIYDESYFWHNTGNGALHVPPNEWVQTHVHSEDPETKRRFKNLLEKIGMFTKLYLISPRSATKAEIEAVHFPNYIKKVKELSDSVGGDAGELAIVGNGSYEIAKLSAGGALSGVDSVMKNEVDNVYALVRPPGHHAEPAEGKGFCLFNNVAIAAKYAKKEYDLDRILILDWDVHHGNGTEKIFYDDPDTLFISLHQEFNYPHTSGIIEHSGVDSGEGYNINIPLPAGTGNAGYIYAFEKIIEPVIKQFKPELIIVSAGQDPSAFDPLGHMMVSAEGFKHFSDIIKNLADEHSDGNLVVCHEGGYSAAYVPFCSLAVLEGISEIQTEVYDPFISGFGIPTNKLYDNQKKAVHDVIDYFSTYWKLNK